MPPARTFCCHLLLPFLPLCVGSNGGLGATGECGLLPGPSEARSTGLEPVTSGVTVGDRTVQGTSDNRKPSVSLQLGAAVGRPSEA